MNTNSKLNGLLGMAAVTLLPCVATTVHADQINTPGTVCQQAVGVTGFGRLDYLPNGGAQFVANPGFTSTRVVCPIPRTPLGPGTFDRIFSIDGNNLPGSTTSCTVTVFTFSGTPKASFSDSDAGTPWHMTFVIPSAILAQFDYTVALCSVPNGSTVRGLTSKD